MLKLKICDSHIICGACPPKNTQKVPGRAPQLLRNTISSRGGHAPLDICKKYRGRAPPQLNTIFFPWGACPPKLTQKIPGACPPVSGCRLIKKDLSQCVSRLLKTLSIPHLPRRMPGHIGKIFNLQLTNNILNYRRHKESQTHTLRQTYHQRIIVYLKLLKGNVT